MKIFSGQRAWFFQRLTAIVVFIGIICCFLLWLFLGSIDYLAWKDFFSSLNGATAVLILFFAIGVHGWIGARDIALDYLQSRSLRLTVLILIALVIIGSTIRLGLILAVQVSR